MLSHGLAFHAYSPDRKIPVSAPFQIRKLSSIRGQPSFHYSAVTFLKHKNKYRHAIFRTETQKKTFPV